MTTTIITATYNKPKYLKEAGLSVLAQTNQDWYWWLILDGPDKETIKVANELREQDARIMIMCEQTTEEARKKAYRPAVIANTYYPTLFTDYVCWLSDDDLLMPNYLELLASALDTNPDWDIVYGTCLVKNLYADGTYSDVTNRAADAPIGKGTRKTPYCNIDGGQFLQTKRSYSVLNGWQIPTDHVNADVSDAIYMQELAKHFTFHPINQLVMIKRITPISTHHQS